MKLVIGILIIAVVVVGAVLLLPRESTAPQDGRVDEEVEETPNPVKVPITDEAGNIVSPPKSERETPAHIVRITDSGFEPSVLAVELGAIVTWVNESSRTSWPASAIHPTHSLYPETGGCIGSSFDACRGLAPGETYKFEFTHEGEWKYHDHLRPTVTGTIRVQ